MQDVEILRRLKQRHIDPERYGLGYVHLTYVDNLIYISLSFRMTSFRKIREGMGLYRTRQQGLTVEDIRQHVLTLRPKYPQAGIREMISLLFHEKGLSVSR
jgi:hypothetical protein